MSDRKTITEAQLAAALIAMDAAYDDVYDEAQHLFAALPDTGLDPERLARALKQIGQPNLIENAQWGYEALATSIAAEYARLTEKE